MKHKFTLSSKELNRLSTEEVQRKYECYSGSLTKQPHAKLCERELLLRNCQIERTNLCGGGSGHVPGAPKGS